MNNTAYVFNVLLSKWPSSALRNMQRTSKNILWPPCLSISREIPCKLVGF